MDPDGSIYAFLTLNLIVSFIICLYISAKQKQDEDEDFAIGISNDVISAGLLLIVDVMFFVVNLQALAIFKSLRFSVLYQLLVLAVFVSIGILLPYSIGLALSERLKGLVKTFSPITAVLNCTVTAVVKLPALISFKLYKLDATEKVTQQDVMDLMEDASDDIIDNEQKEMIENIFELEDLKAGEIMTHRTEVFAINGEDSCIDIIEKAKAEGFSRIPVYSGTIDTILGVLYAKDLLNAIGDEEQLNSPIKNFVRKAMFVPESCPAKELLLQFKLKRMQMAIVVDEYGGTSGIVTMEDVLEEIVGNIQDEYDNEEEEYIQIDKDTIICQASMDLEEVLELLEVPVPDELEQEDFDTVGGLIIDRLARIPDQEEQAYLEYGKVGFTVIEVADRRIVKVRASVIKEENEE